MSAVAADAPGKPGRPLPTRTGQQAPGPAASANESAGAAASSQDMHARARRHRGAWRRRRGRPCGGDRGLGKAGRGVCTATLGGSRVKAESRQLPLRDEPRKRKEASAPEVGTLLLWDGEGCGRGAGGAPRAAGEFVLSIWLVSTSVWSAGCTHFPPFHGKDVNTEPALPPGPAPSS